MELKLEKFEEIWKLFLLKICQLILGLYTGKVYSTVFKKRTVQFYLSGRYDEQAIWKIFKVNRTLLLEWRKWYYEHFESSYYTKPNYGKGKIPTGRKQNTPSSVSSISKSVTAGADEKSRTGNSTGNSRRRPQSEAKKKWKKASLVMDAYSRKIVG